MKRIYADEVEIGQKIATIPHPYDHSAPVVGIVVGITRSGGDDEPVSRITFDLWDWDGIEDVIVWESEEVTIL